MQIQRKFDGEKQINRSQSRYWEGRCAGVALMVIVLTSDNQQ